METIKKKLHQLCINHVQQRMYASELAIAEAQKAGNDDTKSSAGDKYETGREMAQQETNRNLAQLNEANKLMVALHQISYKTHLKKAGAGSLVLTDNGVFYIAISAGILIIDDKKYFAISPASPIGCKLMGCQPGFAFNLNEKNYAVTDIL